MSIGDSWNPVEDTRKMRDISQVPPWDGSEGLPLCKGKLLVKWRIFFTALALTLGRELCKAMPTSKEETNSTKPMLLTAYMLLPHNYQNLYLQKKSIGFWPLWNLTTHSYWRTRLESVPPLRHWRCAIKDVWTDCNSGFFIKSAFFAKLESSIEWDSTQTGQQLHAFGLSRQASLFVYTWVKYLVW